MPIPSTQLTEFEELVNPLDIMISMIFKLEIIPVVIEFYSKYGKTSLSNKGSSQELELILKKYVSKCLSFLSKKYRKRMRYVLSDDGIIYYIYTQFYDLFIIEIENRINNKSDLLTRQ